MGGRFSKSKPEQDSTSSDTNSGTTDTNHMGKLNPDTARKLPAKQLPLKEVLTSTGTSIKNHPSFQPIAEEEKSALPLLTAVVRGNPDELEVLVAANPFLLFKKGQVTDPNGTIFYEVSPYQLMIFLCDDDMKDIIVPLIPEAFESIRKKQYAEIDSGGADLVRMDKDPMSLLFADVTRFIKRYELNPLTLSIDVTFPLLENPDGIIFYNNQFYYANQSTKTIELVSPIVHLQQESAALEKLKASFADMEMNSSRRSSNDEHQLIMRTMPHPVTNQPFELKRQGIQYEHNSVRFRDSRADFNRLLNAYRKCIRLYQEQRWNEGDDLWRRGVGLAQRDVIWVLQRICEEGRPFYPLPDFKASPFRRDFNIFNFYTGQDESVLSRDGVFGGLGSDFAVYKGAGWGRSGGWGWWRDIAGAGGCRDLFAICRLIESAKANVVEFGV